MATELLQARDLEVFHGQSQVLHRLSLTVQEGHVTALLGRNGAGKSTTLNTLAGLHKARSGSIRLADQSLESRSPEAVARSGLRLVPQGRRIFASLSVLENLVVAQQDARDAGKGWTIERVHALFPRLRERTQQRAGTLSGGEQQMLAIGRGLMGNPRVLMLDEPTEGLAPLIVAEVSAAIHKLKAEGLSILLVEQNFKLALEVADDIVVLNTGRVVHAGPADVVRSSPELATAHLGVF